MIRDTLVCQVFTFKRNMCSQSPEYVISGNHATPQGLRHGLAACMAMQTSDPRLVHKLLGHSNLETTAIYMDLVGDEEHAEIIVAW